jgi:hypothetical protein
MPLKTFTLEEANSYLPQIEELLDEMSSLREELASKASVLESVMAHASSNGGGKAASEYLLLFQRFSAAYTMLTQIGCELKDLRLGLVDFPSYRNGQLVYLCWKRGEPRIEHWHELDTGFAGRKKL